MKNKIVIVDYGMGNLNSVLKKTNRVYGNSIISSSHDELYSASKIILPGVGHFSKAVYNLKKLDLWGVLSDVVLTQKTPILGICLGMQLMSKYSEEGKVEGLGWFDAKVVRFKVKDEKKYKVPHMGWNNVETVKESKLFDDIMEKEEYYFVHSYHLETSNIEDVLAETEYEYKFVSALERDNIYGVQFHPEKSHDMGEKMLSNFLKL